MSKLSVAIIGVGLVGKDVLKQLAPLGLRVDVLTNSKHQVVVPRSSPSVPAHELLAALPASSIASPSSGSIPVSSLPLPDLIKLLIQRGKEGPQIVVDCTSDNQVAAAYPALLSSGSHIVTPNKKAFSGSQALFNDIQTAQSQSKSLLYQESTVGAGLPIISTLKDLIATGDRIQKIEGVLSGTMSYIFNNFSKPGDAPAPKFSQVVKIAKENGYTEPHPADDLNGSDVARKLCILSRIIGAPLAEFPEGFASVDTQSLVPKELQDAASGADFMARLPEFDARFESLRSEAAAEGKVLRFVALIDVQSGKVKAGLEKYPFSHPFASALSGSDNIISFQTERYPNPLIIQGAGAGAAVTAMGVVSDIIKIVERVQ